MEVKSNIVTCPRGHQYNGNTHQSCPICASIGGTPVNPNIASFGSTEPLNAPMGGAGNFIPTEAPGAGGFGGAPAGNFIPTETPGMGAVPTGNFAHTEFPGAAGGGVGNFTPTEAPGGNLGNFAHTEDPRNAGGFGGAPSGAMGVTQPVDNHSWAGGGPVGDFVHTQIGGGDAFKAAGQMTPVVGWLVCIDGPSRGTDWRLHAGYNYIGRETGDIHIQGDNMISRKNDTMVAYHNNNHLFYVGPAEGRNIIEVNGEPVFNATKLNAYDIITIGSTRLIFVPLCGEHFNWENPEERK